MNSQSNNSKRNRALIGEWECPDDLFHELNKQYHFTLDACAQPFNAKCKQFFSPTDDGLKKDWKGHTVWCFPPSGTAQLRNWVSKAASEGKKKGTTVVMLLPVSTDSRWFQEHIYKRHGVTVKFLPERVHFKSQVLPTWAVNDDSTKSATRPSMVVTFTNSKAKFAVV